METNKETKRTIRLLNANNNMPLPSQYCERGLEMKRSIRTLQQSQARRVAVIQAVINFQKAHIDMGIRDRDDVGIGRAASAVSVFSKQAAIQQAKMDFDDVYSLTTPTIPSYDDAGSQNDRSCHELLSSIKTHAQVMIPLVFNSDDGTSAKFLVLKLNKPMASFA